ncbi:MAG: 3-isopropylmalate dehydratase small subunit [bacterium]
MIIKGKAWRFGDNIDTDQIYPGKYLPITDKQEMALHAMEGAPGGEEFIENVEPGDIVVAGRNFGCGSSREHAIVAIHGIGVSLLIARSFARIFHRNAVNTGLPILLFDGTGEIKQGDRLEANIENGRISNLSQNKVYQGTAITPLEMKIMKAGGLLDYLKEKKP